MDISGWSMDRILQLPDEAFGRRWLLGVASGASAGGVTWDICSLAFPDKAILWGVFVQSFQDDFNVQHIRLALGDKLPTSTGQMDALEPLMPSVGRPGNEPRAILYDHALAFIFLNMRQPILPQGRRLVFENKAQAVGNSLVMVNILVSSIPNEVPDFYKGFPTDRLDEIIRLLRVGANLPVENPDVSG